MVRIEQKTSFQIEKSIKSIHSGGHIQLVDSRLWTIYSDILHCYDLNTGSILAMINPSDHDAKISNHAPLSSLGPIRSKQDIEYVDFDSEPDIITCFALNCSKDQLPTDIFIARRTQVLERYKLDNDVYKMTKTFKPHDSSILCMIIISSQYLVTASSDHTIKLWSLSNLSLVHHLKGHSSIVTRLFSDSNDPSVLYSSSQDGKLYIWNITSGKCIARCESGESSITGISISPDSQYLITSSRDNTISIWNQKSKSLERTFSTPNLIEGIMTFGDIKEWYLITVGHDESKGMIHIWNPMTFESVHHITISHPILFLSTYNDTIACTTQEHNIHLFDITNHSVIQTNVILGHHQEVTDLTLLGNFFIASSNSKDLKLYHIETLKGMLISSYHDDIILCMASNGNDMFISGSKDTTARVWKLENGQVKCIGIAKGHTMAVGAVAMSHHNTISLFFVTASQDRTIKLWDISQQNEEHLESRFTIKAHEKDINSVDISRKNNIIATASQDKLIKIWKVSDGSQRAILQGHKRGVWCVKFSSLDDTLASSSADGTIRLWNIGSSTWNCTRTLEGHVTSVLRVLFLDNTDQLLSCSSDGLLKLWSKSSQECQATFDQHQDRIWAMAISNENNDLKIITGGADAVINIWKDCTIQEREKKAQLEKEFILMEQEYMNYVARKDYINAISLALIREQPYRLICLLHQLFDSGDDITQLQEWISNVTSHQLYLLLSFIQDWNTQWKHALICQKLLQWILLNSKDQLFSLPKINEILTNLIPFVERHYSKTEDQLIKYCIVDYILYQMHALNTIK